MASKFATSAKDILEDTLKMAEDEAVKLGKEGAAEVKVVLEAAKVLTASAIKNLNTSNAKDALESIANGVAFKLEAIARKDAKEALKRIFSTGLDFAARILGIVLKAV